MGVRCCSPSPVMTDTWEAPRAQQPACLGWLSSLPEVVRKADWESFSMKTACWFLCCRNPIKLSLGTSLMVPGGDEFRGMLATGFDKHPFQPEFLSELVGPVHLSAQLSLNHSQFSLGLSETLLSPRQRKLVCTHIFEWASCHSFLFFWMSQGFYYWENRAHGRKMWQGVLWDSAAFPPGKCSLPDLTWCQRSWRFLLKEPMPLLVS